jgi:hypothetical protein
MTFDLSSTDIGFLCVIIEQPFPLFIEDPFADYSPEKMEREWISFCEQSFSKGLLKLNEEGNPYITENLMEHLAEISKAEQVISIIENEEIRTIIYTGEKTERNVVVKVYPEHYSLSFVTSQGFHRELLSAATAANNGMNQLNEFQLEVSLADFEKLLEIFSEQGADALFTYCENINLPATSISTIISAVHSQNTTVYLTENLRHRETKMTVATNDSGKIKTATTVYSAAGDKVILRETQIGNLPLLLTR